MSAYPIPQAAVYLPVYLQTVYFICKLRTCLVRVIRNSLPYCMSECFSVSELILRLYGFMSIICERKAVTYVLVNAIQICCESPEFYEVDSFATKSVITTITSILLRATKSSLTWRYWYSFHAVKPGSMAYSLSLCHYDDPRLDCGTPSNCNCLYNYCLYLVIRIMPCRE